MSFFISNKTKCVICNKSIVNYFEASQLPYVEPSIAEALAQYARRFVHQRCWFDWEYADTYSDLAYRLVVTRHPDDSPLRKIFELDKLAVFWSEAQHSYRLEDFSSLVFVDISQGNQLSLLNFLISAFSHKKVNWQNLAYKIDWEVKPANHAREFTIYNELGFVKRFVISSKRSSVWILALEEICNLSNELQPFIPNDIC